MYAELRGQALDKIDLKSRSSTQTSGQFSQNAKFALNVRLHPLTTQQIGFTIGRRDLCTFLVSTPPKLTEPLREEIRGSAQRRLICWPLSSRGWLVP